MRVLHLLLLAAAGMPKHAACAAEIGVTQSAQTFSQRAVALAVGDTLVFNNADDVTHNISVINDDDDPSDLGLQKPGQVLSYKFDRQGRFKVRCSIHPGMKLAVTVQ